MWLIVSKRFQITKIPNNTLIIRMHKEINCINDFMCKVVTENNI